MGNRFRLVDRWWIYGKVNYDREKINYCRCWRFWIGNRAMGRDAIQNSSCEYDDISFLEDDENQIKTSDHNITFKGSIKDYIPQTNDLFVMAIANSIAREKIAKILTLKGAIFGNVIHPSSIITETSQIGFGIVTSPWSIVSSNAILGNHIQLNIMTSIGHHTNIGSYSTFSSHVDITANYIIGERVFFGSGARSIPGCKVADDSIIGAGAIVQEALIKKQHYFKQVREECNF